MSNPANNAWNSDRTGMNDENLDHFRHSFWACETCRCGSKPAGFEHRILKNWRALVADDDMVIHLGDVFLCKISGWKDTFTNLPGRKILVIGNHDKNSLNWYMHNGFDFACHKFIWEMYGKSLLFTHAPMEEFPGRPEYSWALTYGYRIGILI